MAVIKCKMCGGDLHVEEGSTVCECEYCGTRQTVPSADNEKKLTLFNRAGRLLRACEFDKAAGVFETIVADFPEEAEAYWGLVLCKYGIEYVDDPVTGRKIPTCHRSSFESVLDDPNFEQACENTDAVARRVYRDEARAIEELRQAILSVSGKEEPYDVFISYKETDENGERTLDSVIAQDIYKELTSEGYRVFFSRISLESKLGTEYEPYIFAALNSAKVMIVVGTDYENFDSVWVKNEWSRFLKLIAAGQKKTLIPVFKNMDAYDMPKEFNKLAALDMGKVGAMQDLVRGVGKIVGKKKTEPDSFQQPMYVSSEADAKTAAAVKRGRLALEEGDWERAKDYFEQALTLDAEIAEAYFCMALAEAQCRNAEEYAKRATGKTPERKTVSIEPDSAHIQAVSEQYAIPRFFEGHEIRYQYQSFNFGFDSEVEGQKKLLNQEKQAFESNRNISLAYRFAKGGYRETLQKYKSALYAALEENVRKAEQEESSAAEKKREEYNEFLKQKNLEVSKLHQEKQIQRDKIYTDLCKEFETVDTSYRCLSIKERFQYLGSYKESEEYIQKCDARIAELKEKEQEEQKEQLYNKYALVFSVNIPDNYKNWEYAKEGFESLGDYKDAPICAEKCAERIAQIQKEEEAKRKAEADEAERKRRAAAEEVERKRLQEEKAERARKAKKKKQWIFAGILAVVAVAVYFICTTVTANNKSKEAIALYDSGKYKDAYFAFLANSNDKKTVDFYTERAVAGDDNAMNYLGIIYHKGIGVDKNDEKALAWFLKSAELENGEAAMNIGLLYEHGIFVEQNEEKAAEWYQKAMKWYLRDAESGNSDAMYSLGKLYDEGLGVDQDYSKAREWYVKAANEEDNQAMFALGFYYHMGYGVSQDYQQAMDWYQKSADAGNVSAMCNIGVLYENGTGVAQSYQNAMAWYLKAADGGSAKAMENIAELYENGKGVARDNNKAKEWYQKAKEAQE